MAIDTAKNVKPMQRGIKLPCPCCDDMNADIMLDMIDQSMTCRECDSEFTVECLREMFAKWTPVLAWLETMPTD